MAEVRIDISELKSEGDELIKQLANFLKERTGAAVETAANEVIVKSEEETIARRYLKVLLRKFLHKVELKQFFRVIGGKENKLIIKEKKTSIEEE